MKTQVWREPIVAAGERVCREARGIWRKTRNGAEDALDEGEQWVRRHPYPGLLAGWGVGLLVGVALGSAWKIKAKAATPPASSPTLWEALGRFFRGAPSLG